MFLMKKDFFYIIYFYFEDYKYLCIEVLKVSLSVSDRKAKISYCLGTGRKKELDNQTWKKCQIFLRVELF